MECYECIFGEKHIVASQTNSDNQNYYDYSSFHILKLNVLLSGARNERREQQFVSNFLSILLPNSYILGQPSESYSNIASAK